MCCLLISTGRQLLSKRVHIIHLCLQSAGKPCSTCPSTRRPRSELTIEVIDGYWSHNRKPRIFSIRLRAHLLDMWSISCCSKTTSTKGVCDYGRREHKHPVVLAFIVNITEVHDLLTEDRIFSYRPGLLELRKKWAWLLPVEFSSSQSPSQLDLWPNVAEIEIVQHTNPEQACPLHVRYPCVALDRSWWNGNACTHDDVGIDNWI